MMHVYALLAMASLAVLPAYVIVKANIPRAIHFSILAGVPVIPITVWGIYSWVIAEPEGWSGIYDRLSSDIYAGFCSEYLKSYCIKT